MDNIRSLRVTLRRTCHLDLEAERIAREVVAEETASYRLNLHACLPVDLDDLTYDGLHADDIEVVPVRGVLIQSAPEDSTMTVGDYDRVLVVRRGRYSAVVPILTDATACCEACLRELIDGLFRDGLVQPATLHDEH